MSDDRAEADSSVGYAVTGSGPGVPLVFVPGWCCSRELYSAQLAWFAPRHRVAAVSLRGHGDSSWPGGTTLVTMQEFVDDVVSVLRAADLRRPVIVGHSMGGLVALAAASRPETLSAAVLLDPAPIVSPVGKVAYERWSVRALADESGDWRRRFAAKLMRDTDLERREEIAEMMAGVAPPIAAAAARGMLCFDGATALREIAVPTLCIDSGPPQEDAVALAPTMELARTVGAGHFVQVHAADQVNAMIERFLTVAVAPRPAEPPD